MRYGLHLHIENEIATCSHTIRLHLDVAPTFLDDLPDYHQTKSDASTVYLRCTVQFSESRKKLGKIFLGYSNACVFNLDD